jgi:hypothetical protein
MPVINGVYLKDFTALPSSVTDANIIPIAITGNQIAYRTTVGGIVTDARVTSKLLTGLSVTGGAIAATDTILQAFGKVQNQINSKVSSVGLTMPSAFNVANSPITSSGTLAVTAIGAASQYIRGDGALADFPTNGGGGSSVSYYLNGSVSQGTIGGNAYYEMNKTPVIGAGTDFTIGADGYIAQFITDANDPASLLIPAGNWNVEMYFSASSSGGTPSFYVEVYKYNGTTFTLLGTSSATPEGITNGTAIDIYYTSVGIPETVLAITDRLAIRVYVTHSGRTITLHTEDNHLSEIVTTFSNGLTALNGLTKQAQYFAVGTTGTDFNISSSVDTHTFNIPSASATARGLITTGTQTIAGQKTFSTGLTGTLTGSASLLNGFASDVTEVSNTIPRRDANSDIVARTYFMNTTYGDFAPTKLVGTSSTGQIREMSQAQALTYLNISGTYLPLAGGTLTGALSGTSATFTGTTLSGVVKGIATSGFGVSGEATSGNAVTGNATTGVGGIFIANNTGGVGLIADSYTGVIAKFQASGTDKVTIANTGALTGTSATFSGAVTINDAARIDAANGNQLILDNAGERFTQIDWYNNNSGKSVIFWDNTNNYFQIQSTPASSKIRVVAQTNGVELANGGTSWSSLSDIREKTIIRPSQDALTTLKDYRTVIGRYNTDLETVERAFLIAQDVQMTYPYAVTEDDDEDQRLRLSYTELIPLLVKSIQELKAEIDILKNTQTQGNN